MSDILETVEAGAVRFVIRQDTGAECPRGEDFTLSRVVPVSALRDHQDTNTWQVKQLGWDSAYELGDMLDAWDRLGGKDGHREELRDAPGFTFATVPGWAPVADFGSTPFARWARIFHGVEVFLEDLGSHRDYEPVVAWIDVERLEAAGIGTRGRDALDKLLTGDLAPYRAWAEGSVYMVTIEIAETWIKAADLIYGDVDAEERTLWTGVEAVGGYYWDDDAERLDVLREMLDYADLDADARAAALKALGVEA